MQGHIEILDTEIGTLIYGAGKRILRSFQDFDLCAEPYMIHSENTIYYFGDLDYEGSAYMRIWQKNFSKDGKYDRFCRHIWQC